MLKNRLTACGGSRETLWWLLFSLHPPSPSLNGGAGPTDTTVVDFWRMVWQLHSPTVVMMTNLEEGRKKCEQYWPNFGTADYGPYSVTLAEQKIRANYTIRKLTLTVCLRLL